jgi:putative oxidoreductase
MKLPLAFGFSASSPAGLLLRGRETIDRAMSALQSPGALLVRLYVAKIFFMSGLTKVQDWDTTLALFSEEYKVPLLPPELAAYLGTFGELALPVMLVAGLGGRIAALGLSVVNVVAVLSLSEISDLALQQHITWGALLACLAVFGCGRWGLDSLLRVKWE